MKSFHLGVLFALLCGPAFAAEPDIDVLRPYRGPSVAGVDTSTLTGKVMCGYQGWFNCEGDGVKPRTYSLDECRELIEFLKADGCTVMLGVATGWRDLDRDAMADPDLHAVLQLADILSPWSVGRYRDLDDVAHHAKKYWTQDIAWCDQHDLDYLPVVFPGFSWHHQKGGKLGKIPRLKGQFFWSQIAAAKRAGARMIYVVFNRY